MWQLMLHTGISTSVARPPPTASCRACSMIWAFFAFALFIELSLFSVGLVLPGSFGLRARPDRGHGVVDRLQLQLGQLQVAVAFGVLHVPLDERLLAEGVVDVFVLRAARVLDRFRAFRRCQAPGAFALLEVLRFGGGTVVQVVPEVMQAEL